MSELVIGGLNGFVGSNTTEALVEMGKTCVVTQHNRPGVPSFLQEHIDSHRVIVEPTDATSISDLRRIGEKHKIESIVNVGGGFRTPGPRTPLSGLKGYFDMLDAIFKLAEEWKVRRVTFSSTGGMYLGLSGTVDEAKPIFLQSPLPGIPGILQRQKIVEVASEEFSNGTGISSICTRLMGFYGPYQDLSQGSVVLRLVHAAVSGKPLDLKGAFFTHADDGVDLIYIKDLARAVASLHTAEKLNHKIYNIGTGKTTQNSEIVESVKKAVPGFNVELPPGRFPFPPIPTMDVKRLRDDTGFAPKFDTESGIQDYVDWLKAGNPK
ncbi:MAG TPA: NAD(P)-dependent oxidoreductase [Candidatus Dormibacteraeota bacterium]|jgi:UDP-glucose 4-epimerase|nr:NAD(P)-dependent oxidoreductase [Candidatus Dormibacteraeota bacterium]